MKMWAIKKGKMYLANPGCANNNVYTSSVCKIRLYSTEKRARTDIIDDRETVIEVEVNIKEVK